MWACLCVPGNVVTFVLYQRANGETSHDDDDASQEEVMEEKEEVLVEETHFANLTNQVRTLLFY